MPCDSSQAPTHGLRSALHHARHEDGHRPRTHWRFGRQHQRAHIGFVEQDPTKAETVIKRDSEVDQLYLSASNEIQKRMHADSDYLYHGIHLQAMAKFLERIGDHITNLAELVIFMVWGKDIRHTGKLPGDVRPGSETD